LVSHEHSPAVLSRDQALLDQQPHALAGGVTRRLERADAKDRGYLADAITRTVITPGKSPTARRTRRADQSE